MRPSCAGSKGSARIRASNTSRILRLSEDVPVVIEIVDRADRVQAVLPMLDEMIGEGLITLEKVQVIAYRADDGA